MSSRSRRAFLSALTLVCLASSAVSNVAVQEPRPIPPRVKAWVLGASQRVKLEVVLDGTKFLAHTRQSQVPFVLWPAEKAPALEKSEPAVSAWLARSSAALGHAGLDLVFDSTSSWQQGEVWNYRVLHQGIPLFDTTFEVLWNGSTLEGLRNNLPLPLVAIEPPSADLAANKDWVYHAAATPAGNQLHLAWRVEVPDGGVGRWTRLENSAGTLRQIHSAPAASAPTDATFTEYVVPSSNFPDQIDIDSSGRVWFSQPFLNSLTSFHPESLQFRLHPTGGGTPDGLWIDPLDRVWTGLYDSNAGLGRYDIETGAYAAFAPPYAGANMAIPVYSRSNRIFVTDHAQNRLSQFDPVALTWISHESMPTPACWVVQGSEDAANQTLYFTEFNVDKLGRKPWNNPVVDIQVPLGAGPAFDVFSRGSIYYSQWNRGRLGRYVIATGEVFEYNLPLLPNEAGGPIDVTPTGQIALGTRSTGYIAMFDPGTLQFTMHAIPTPFSGLKDGLVVDPSGTVWFTESGANKLGKLTLP